MNYHKHIVCEAQKVQEILQNPGHGPEIARNFDPEEKIRLLQMTKGLGSNEIKRYRESIKEILQILARDKTPLVRELAEKITKKFDKKFDFGDMTPFSQRDYSGIIE